MSKQPTPDRLSVIFAAHRQLLGVRNELDRVGCPKAARKVEVVLRSLAASFGAENGKQYRAAIDDAKVARDSRSQS